MYEGDLGLENLSDRARITDVLIRYCRGLDRCDVALLHSVVHEDAVADHGVAKGNARELYTALARDVQVQFDRTTHSITNIYFEKIEAELAFVETHIFAYHEIPGDPDRVEAILGPSYRASFDWSAVHGIPHQFTVVARYADRFEKRNHEWRIARRTVITDWWQCALQGGGRKDEGFFPSLHPRGARGPSDPSYLLLLG